ncbi:MAG: hypothetical protein HDR90_03610 [Bacteroides sp.]|nr:hypothetical protein [Bacteroides sp.]
MNSKELENKISETDKLLSSLKVIEGLDLGTHIVDLESAFREFKSSGEELLKSGEILQIGIVGQVKAGKSSFLNSLFFDGKNILPRASTPMTAGLTVIEYAETNTFEIEYFSREEWEIFVRQNDEYSKIESEVRKNEPGAPQSVINREIESRTSEKMRSAHEMVSMCSNAAKSKIGSEKDVKSFSTISELQDVLEKYVGASGEYTSVVKSLYIKLNDERLKGIRIVDTPGVNDPVVSRENRTRQFLQSCHGVFLLSASTDFMGSGDIGFLNSRIGGSGIGAVVILASKFDSVLQDRGAERIMKEESSEDLQDAAKDQTKKFRRRLNELQSSIVENLQGKIKIDTTAGIGYSIARKSESEWDDIESAVVSQMKKFYADYFDSYDHIKESFNWLANIDDVEDFKGIRSKYLLGEFLEHKNEIISKRINEFFVRTQADIESDVAEVLKNLHLRHDTVKKATVDAIEEQKKLQSILFENLKEKFALVFNKFLAELQNKIKKLSNNIEFSKIRSIPTEPAIVDFTCKGKLWGTNTEEISIDQVNTYELAVSFENEVKKYLNDWNENWKKLFSDIQIELADQLTESISSFQKKLMSSLFNEEYYRNLIDNALTELSKSGELSIGSIRTRYVDLGHQQAQIFEPSDTSNRSESDARSYITSSLRKFKEQLVNGYSNLAEALKSDVKNEVERHLKSSTEILQSLKTSFASRLKDEGDKYLKQLEEDAKDKAVALEKLDSAINILNQIQNLYK